MDINKLVRPNILALQPYRSARSEYNNAEAILLDANENPYGTLNRYPDPLQQDLKAAISTWKEISTDRIFIGNGSDEIIDLCIRIFCIPGTDAVLSFHPSYGMYQVSAQINDVQYLTLPLNPQFQIDQEALAPYLDDPCLKILFLCSPNNPTGNRLEGIDSILQRFQGIVLIDEAYIDFSTGESWLRYLDQYPNLIVCQTLSKAGGLAAVRIGMAFAHPDIIALLNKVKPPYNISSINQTAALTALSQGVQAAQTTRTIIQERDWLSIQLQQYNWIQEVYPSEANFILIRVLDPTGLYRHLVHQGVIIRNRDQELPGCLRISVGTHEENTVLVNALFQYSTF